ncbi:MAG: peptidoglycan-binding domain-containing protein [Patescibacteria group bacterium]
MIRKITLLVLSKLINGVENYKKFMSNLLKSKFLLGVMTLAIMFVGAVAVATTASADCSITTTLRLGSAGAEVACLQSKLNGGLVADGKFGPMTEAAVKVWQAAKGLTADGIVGPISRSALVASGSVSGNFPAGCQSAAGYSPTTGAKCDSGPSAGLPAGCSSTSGFSVTTGQSCSGTTAPSGPLAGTAGTVTYTQLSQYTNEKVGAGVTDVKVAGFELEASDGDVSLRSFKLTFSSTGNAAADSDRLIDYLDSVSIWQGSTEVGSADAADFTRDSAGVYSKVVTVSNAIVRDGDVEKFYISVDAATNIDSADIDSDSWGVDPINVRYEDGGGVVSTDTITQTEIPMSFVTSASATDTELKLTVDSTLKAGVQTVNVTSDTNDVLLLKGTLEIEGESDVWVDEIPFLFTTNATNADAVSNTVYLTIDGTEFSESMGSAVGTTETITFNELNKTLAPGKYVFTVTADVNDIEADVFDEGDYLLAELTATTRASVVALNTEGGDQLTDGTEMTGVAAGTIQYFYSKSPKVEVLSSYGSNCESSIKANDNGSSAPSSATAKLCLKITANGGTIYLNGNDETTQAKEFFGIAIDGGDASSTIANNGGYSFTPSGTYTVTDDATDNEYYTLNEGDVMYVGIESTLVEGVGSAAILVGMKGDEILFGTASTSDTTRSANTLNFTALLDILKTGKVTLDS